MDTGMLMRPVSVLFQGQMRRDKRMEYVSAASAVELSNKSRDPLAGGSCAARPSWDPCSMAEVIGPSSGRNSLLQAV